jgi:hypothetical protein
MQTYPAIDELEADMKRPTDTKFETLRRKRDGDIAEIVHGLFTKERAGMEIAPDALAMLFRDRDFHARCYCGCPDGPCQHDFKNWRANADGSGPDHACIRCGLSWRRHALRRALKHPPTN